MQTLKYNGNDVFAPFNAGLYGIDGDSDRSLRLEDSKASILSAFESEYKVQLAARLEDAGLRFVGLKYYSPAYYNYSTDSIDLEIEIVDARKLITALEARAEDIEKALKANKSYDGFIATTEDSYSDVIVEAGKGNLDILALKVLLAGIDFEDFDLYEHLEWDYACDTCEKIHEDIDLEDAEGVEKIKACAEYVPEIKN